MTKTLTIWGVLLLAGCGPVPQSGYRDQDVRRDVFFECLKALPAGPQATMYNDWAEVVGECGDQAYNISARGYSDVRAAEKVEKQ
jgi:hypothetical protein